MGSPYRMLTPGDSAAKTAKRPVGVAVANGILYLAPARLSGHETCGTRTKGCTDACLGHTSGHGAIGVKVKGGKLVQSNSVQEARIRRARALFEARSATLADLVSDAELLVASIGRRRIRPVLRLNGTSDLDWYRGNYPVVRGTREYASLAHAFPRITFYEYTKNVARMHAWLEGKLPPNVHLTFSLAETKASSIAAAGVIAAGGNVAVAFRLKKNEPFPAMWRGRPVIDGDAHDLRFLDPRASAGEPGYWIGLRAKGKSYYDRSGFIMNPDE